MSRQLLQRLDLFSLFMDLSICFGTFVFILALGLFLQLSALPVQHNLNVHLGVVFRPCRLAGNVRILQRNLTCDRLQIVYLFIQI